MKSYTVKELSKILKTNPETVRRWIRDGKLEAYYSSRKEGNLISETSLVKFLESTPKYAKIAGEVVGITGIVALTATFPPLMIALNTLSHFLFQDAKEEDIQIPLSEIQKIIENAIENSQKIIIKKEQEIEEIQQDVQLEKQKILNYKKIIKQIKKEGV